MSFDNIKNEIPKIVEYINDNKKYISVNRTLFEIYNGRLTKYLHDAIDAETKTDNTKFEIKARIATINILQKVVGKLSKVYTAKVSRKLLYTDNALYQEIFDNMEISLELNDTLKSANELLNVSHCVALEPVFSNGKNELRVIPAHQFLPYSSDEDDHTRMTHFIKFIGNENCNSKIIKCIVYDENSWVEINGAGAILDYGEHNLGVIPFIYINRSKYLLKPFEDEDTLHMTLLLPLMLTDLNFALRFQSHSIVYGVNVDASNLSMTPNSFWSFQSNGGDGDKPIIGTINPTVDSDKMIATINHEFALWLDTKNIKTSALKNGATGESVSGISKAIDNADVNDIIDTDTNLFRNAEAKLWELIRRMYNANFMEKTQIDEQNVPEILSDDFAPTILFFKTNAIIETNKDSLENIITKLYNGFMTKKMALREIYPDMIDEEVDLLQEDIDNERLQDKYSDNNLSATRLSNLDAGADREKDNNENS